MSLDQAPAQPGSYALHLRLALPVFALPVGRLGNFDFPAGDYLYLGSAAGPGGLRARLAHHARAAARAHWHIDFLRTNARLLGAWIAPGGRSLECVWSQALLDVQGSRLPAAGFGATDCRLGCPAHLVQSSASLVVPVLQSFTDLLQWLEF